MEFFAGANTVNGFVSLFDECFKDIETLYILKGSSGCGKSTLMRRIAGKAQREGIPFDTVRCSADPESLDGVILPTLSVAVADGTSPHLLDVKYPCVRETIINLGEFWESSLITPHREKIIELIDKKSECYSSAYRTLAAYGRVEDALHKTVSGALNRKKLDEFVISLAEKLAPEKGECRRLLCSALTAGGIKTLETFGEVKCVYRIKGAASQDVLDALLMAVKERGRECTVACRPTDVSLTESLYFKASDTIVTLLDTPPCSIYSEEVNISAARFTDNSRLASSRARLKTVSRLADELLNDVCRDLAAAKAVHSEIEALYIPAMNFKKLNEFTLELINSVFANK